MSHPVRTARSAMSPCTHTIAANAPVAAAARLMREHGIRHLPVLEGGTLRGIVTERDLLLAETLVGFEGRKLPVSDTMTLQVYAVGEDAPLAVVVRTMAIEKYGCAVVLSGEMVVGIVTTVDVCRVLADCLEDPTSVL